jgi:hypothetical protein
MKFKCLLLLGILSIFSFSPFALAEEKITITTYYPSPYGSYNQLQADKLGVGDNNSDGSFTSSDVPVTSGDVWIKGNVGIGTTQTIVSPLKKLILKGLGTTTGIGLQILNSSNTVLLTTLDSGNVGIGTATPTDKLQIDTSIALHSGGNKVIGFGWSPGVPPNGQALMAGYPAEIRWSPSGLLELGIDQTSRSAGQIPAIMPNLIINTANAIGINTVPLYPYTLDVFNPRSDTTIERIQNTHMAQTVWQATAGGSNTHGQINVFNDPNWQGGVGMQVGTFNTSRGVSIVAGGNGVITVQPTYNPATNWYGRVGINKYSPAAELDVNGNIVASGSITASSLPNIKFGIANGNGDGGNSCEGHSTVVSTGFSKLSNAIAIPQWATTAGWNEELQQVGCLVSSVNINSPSNGYFTINYCVKSRWNNADAVLQLQFIWIAVGQ